MAKTISAVMVHLPEADLEKRGSIGVSFSRRALLFGNGTLVAVRSDGHNQTLVVRHVPRDERWRYSVITKQVEVPVEVYDDAFGILRRETDLLRYLPELLDSLPVTDPLKERVQERLSSLNSLPAS